MHKKSTFILAEEVEFIMKIHNKTDDKIREMQEATGIELQEVTSYESLKKVTDLIMTKLRKSTLKQYVMEGGLSLREGNMIVCTTLL